MVTGVSTALDCEVCNVENDEVTLTVTLGVILTTDEHCKESEAVTGEGRVILPPNGEL